ncbi:MAG TPA: FtsX-like permease family protein [Steroidobacteraceae bacterium]|nr:FtsX-like permease family protein [Steroidobacteraceae bacterium]
MNIKPVVSALLRNRVGAVLVALEIAIALAVLVNAAFIVGQRIAAIEEPTGLDYHNMFSITMAGVTSDFDAQRSARDDIAYIRSMHGVTSAAPTGMIPMSGNGSNGTLYTEPGQRGKAAAYSVVETDEQGMNTLGATLIGGRNFRATEILHASRGQIDQPVPEIIVTQSLARALFQEHGALGQVVYDRQNRPMTIIGVVRDFIGQVGFGSPPYQVAFMPRIPGAYGVYVCLVHTAPGKAESIMQLAEQHLAASNPTRVILDAYPLDHYKDLLDSENRNMAIFLVVVTSLILAITCLGIFGLTTFNVSTRTKQIGTMRAVGARKRDVVTHFLLENAIIVASGVLIGCTLALGVGYWLSTEYAQPRLDMSFLAAGVLILVAVGQLAAWQPARRAASVPPSVATRTV